jgi:phosphoribosylaminoimidazolecarboxamide formyltransferase/IMP cyclohydrolase
MSKRQALISVSDKTGVVELARGLNDLGYSIISSGGTAKTLADNKIPCTEISRVTGFPEILDGRVKTLNPRIHGGILARRDRPEHLDELKQHDIAPIDIVIVNLYPFEKTLTGVLAADPGSRAITDDIIENIDIGGVALIRAAAKNFNDVLIVCQPADYASLLQKLKDGKIDADYRRSLAAKAFSHTAYYDALISSFFSTDKFPEQVTIPLRRLSSLRYGENPHQAAALYRAGAPTANPFVVNARQLQGKELSYNNYLDLEAAWRLVAEFSAPACAIIKHNNPCGCAESDSLLDAYHRALACDPLSAYGGIIALNREVDEKTAAEIAKLFVECIIAPSFSDKALAAFAAKKNLRLLLPPPSKTPGAVTPAEIEYRALSGGMLAQDRDNSLLTETKPATKRTPTEAELRSLQFAWKIAKHVKSNAIVLVRGTQAVGIGAGQMSRIDSLHIAAQKMKSVELTPDAAGQPLVLASDAFFPFNDVVTESAAMGVTAVIQPGGSIRDKDSIQAADQNTMAMVFTGMRHFKH